MESHPYISMNSGKIDIWFPLFFMGLCNDGTKPLWFFLSGIPFAIS
jgi:hypothetical protein